MKTLDELIERKDYKVVNARLRKRCAELGEKLLKACQLIELDEEEEFQLGGLTFSIRTLKPRCGFTEDIIYLHDGEERYAINRELSYYFCNDYNYYVNAAPSKIFLHFLNNAKDVFADLECAQDGIIHFMNESLKCAEEL